MLLYSLRTKAQMSRQLKKIDTSNTKALHRNGENSPKSKKKQNQTNSPKTKARKSFLELRVTDKWRAVNQEAKMIQREYFCYKGLHGQVRFEEKGREIQSCESDSETSDSTSSDTNEDPDDSVQMRQFVSTSSTEGMASVSSIQSLIAATSIEVNVSMKDDQSVSEAICPEGALLC
ncbi:hypothetical protein CHS0354_032266 [Potamilus streckersoni]|uniref:Uncharacterized protein n=1 Tax=Potamilus streckersoni TaxID=2493646 RepID=A0AAE0RPS6_9BIVA|nr:hypothetical protein CHS0354_032266 [Potamilus streckersoni]